MSDNTVFNSRVSGAARLLRGWIVAVLAVLLAVGGHQAAHSVMHGSTEVIPLELLAFSTALTAPVAVGLAGKRLSTWSTASTAIFGQLAFHILYSLPYSGVHAAHSGHEHHGHHQAALSVVTEAHSTHAVHTAVQDAVMLAAHLLAAVLTTAIIVHGERSLIAIIAWLTLAPSRFVLAALPASIVRPKTVQPMIRVWIPRPMNVSQTRSTRGPPVLA